MAIPGPAILAWITRQSDSPIITTYVMIGIFFIFIWQGMVFPIGWSVSQELNEGTLDFSLISRTSIMAIIFGKASSELVNRFRVAFIAVLVFILVSRETPVAQNFPLLVCSMLFVIIGIAATCLLFAPLFLLAKGKPGFWNAIIPFGTILSCFLIPVVHLPAALGVISRIFPASWAMQGIWFSINGESTWQIVQSWGMCLVTAVLMLIITYFMFKEVEKRIRITGVL